MSEKIQLKDFVEIDFTAKLKDSGEVFDTTYPEIFKTINDNPNMDVHPMKLILGEKMILQALEEQIAGKEVGEKFSVDLPTEKAFGPRDSKLIKIASLSLFKNQKVQPYKGLVLNIDGNLAKVVSVNGGRVSLDFNSPLAGKDVSYEIKINKKITEEKEKIEMVLEIFFQKKIPFEIKENKVIVKAEKFFEQLVKIFGPKFKELTGKELDFEEVKEETKKTEPEKIESSEKTN